MVKTVTSILFAIVVVFLIGCARSSSSQSTGKRAIAKSSHTIRITLLGGQSGIGLLNQLAAASGTVVRQDQDFINATARVNQHEVLISTSRSEKVAAHAMHCESADLAVIVTDATVGPTPVEREHILFARQMHVPRIMIAFTNSRVIDDPELLELEELEMRELLNNYGWNGDEAVVGFDSEQARTRRDPCILVGSRALLQHLAQTAEHPTRPTGVQSSRCTTEIYVLAEQEAFPLKTTGLSSGSYTVVVGGSTRDAEVQVASTITPSQNGLATITFREPIAAYQGQRFVILVNDHIAAAGFIAKTQPHTPAK